MLKRLVCLAFVAGLLLTGSTMAPRNASAQTQQEDDPRIADLVKKLGSMNYAEREKARKDLEMLGMAALDHLRVAAKTDDLEIRTRCEKLIDKLETKLTAEKLLTPKKVHLNVKDVTVVQAIEELQKRSGYPIHIDGDRVPLSKRTITLDTGEVTFWEAFDQLCEKGHLSQVATGVNGGGTDMPRLVPVQVMPAQVVPPPPMALPAGKPGQAVPKPGAAPAGAKPPALPEPVPMKFQVELPAAGGNAGAVMPVQIQLQGQVQMQPAPLPGKGLQPGWGATHYPPGTLIVRDGIFTKVPTCYSGAIRIRLLPASQASEVVVQPRQDGEALYIVEAAAEPRLQMFAVTGNPSLHTATDDLHQELTVAMEPMPGANGAAIATVYSGARSVRQVVLRLKQGAKKAAELTELKGLLTVESLTPTPEALITVADLEKAVGKKVEGKKGGSIAVESFAKQADGTYKVRVTYQAPQPFYPVSLPGNEPLAVQGTVGGVGMLPANGQVIARPSQPVASQARLLPQLVDANGKVLKLEQMPLRSARGMNGVVVQDITMIYRAGEGVGAPTQVILFGHNKVTAEVPFAFTHVPLQ
jgi:hypothetical protein